MKRQKLIVKGVRTARDIPTAELERKAAQADLNPALTAPPYRPLPPISKLAKV